MSPEKQRIAIAEACGWKPYESLHIVPHPRGRGFMKCDGEHPDGYPSNIPDYLNDLNAMHEAEKTLTRGQLHQYMLNMQDVKGLGGNNHWLNFHATAAQRAEAFLRTIGKWKEES